MNQLLGLTLRAVNSAADRQGRANGIERHTLDPARPDELERSGLDLLGDGLDTPSQGLHAITSDQLRAFALHLVTHATETPLHVDNAQSEALASRGHLYLYRSAHLPITEDAAAYVDANPKNSMRLCVRAFTRGALELPPGTIERLREQVRAGARHGRLLRQLRDDPQVRAHQRTQWEQQATLAGEDVLLGLSSIVLITRHERYALEGGRFVVDLINPATRELHILDGSNIWLRVLDTQTRSLTFAVVGTGKHRFAVMDALNNLGAMSIWQYLSGLQTQLYSGVPSDEARVEAHIADALHRSGPATVKLSRTLAAGDNAPSGAFLRRLRRTHPHETGDAYA
ncbi:hypothetical protein N865_12980 [Intrasporangium oryzae NRRL B-24470]|uniref:Uncharacterized protein n=1 Tax=Intrasporangium oryzae NRRL B-24470 TaxID=1386089 RepID=W9G642_9MICO|nr:hypothetical protein [Intrasporangium oryzae]EWT00268.1 hypothetical protein N865_12980 [Intrasporangium oryzae NRRL B-24470]